VVSTDGKKMDELAEFGSLSCVEGLNDWWKHSRILLEDILNKSDYGCGLWSPDGFDY